MPPTFAPTFDKKIFLDLDSLWETNAWTVNRDNIAIALTGGVHVLSLFLQMLDVDFLAAFRFFALCKTSYLT